MKGDGFKIRYREGFRWSPPEGQRQDWHEYQVVDGRKIVGRYDFVEQAERDYPGAKRDASVFSSHNRTEK